MGVGEAVIDLGEATQAGARATAPPPPARRRPVLAAVSLLLLALLTGAVHRGPPAAPHTLAARLGDTTVVYDDRLFVVGPGPRKTIAEYALPSGRLLSRSTAPVPGAIFDVQPAGAVLLVSYQVENGGAETEATVALVPGTDRVLWTQPARLLAASPADGLALLRVNSPEPVVHWFGVALDTGEVRWQMRRPARGFIVEADLSDGFPRMLVTADATGRIEVRDARTGRVTSTVTARLRDRPTGADVPIWPAGDLVLAGGPGGTTAYRLPDLAERWRSPVDLTGSWVRSDCIAGICSLSWQGGVTLLDRDTGARRWGDSRWNYVDPAGDVLLAHEVVPDRVSQRVSVLDPVTGRVLGDFGRWRPVGTAAPDGTMIGLREHLVDDTVWYARLDPADRTVRLLGTAKDVSGDCRTTPDVLVCRRIDASVGLWALK